MNGKKWRVEIIESELGWGSKVDEVKEFDTWEEANEFTRDYNTKYNPPSDNTPDWYMYANLEGQGYGMLRWED